MTLNNGARPVMDFGTFDEAKGWITDTLANAHVQHQPELGGGPTRSTLAQALQNYAMIDTVAKGGVAAEINRINHYLVAEGRSPLRGRTNVDGRVTLETYVPKTQPLA